MLTAAIPSCQLPGSVTTLTLSDNTLTELREVGGLAQVRPNIVTPY